MSVRDLKVKAIICDGCRRFGGISIAEHGNLLPRGWGYITKHDCGMTGYSRDDLYCDSCLLERKGGSR